MNIRSRITTEPDFTVFRAGSSLNLREILSIRTDEEFTARFAGSPLMRAGRRNLIRNACICAANNGAEELLPLLRALSESSDPLIAEHAAWAVQTLEPDSSKKL